ncbi:MAG TPA: hypothetical protein VJ839_05190 [Candidatus Limnocylindria bacterium]|nr:hypothetical protein [Candidatus Limnocylindria bacterium]
MADSADDCEPIEYVTPAGERVDLTGTWRGSFGVHYIRQDGSCVWWVGLEENESEELGARIMVVFRGELGADFTITGEWMSVNRSSFISDRRHGSVTFRIDFGSAGDTETIMLRSTLADAPQGGLGPYAGGVTLVYEGPLPQVPLY